MKASNIDPDNNICTASTTTATTSTTTSTNTNNYEQENNNINTNTNKKVVVINETTTVELEEKNCPEPTAPQNHQHQQQLKQLHRGALECLLPTLKEVLLRTLSEEDDDEGVPTTATNTSSASNTNTSTSNDDLNSSRRTKELASVDRGDNNINDDDVDDFNCDDDDIIPFDACEYEKIVCCSTTSTVNLNNTNLVNSAPNSVTSSRFFLIIITSKSCIELNNHFKRSTE